MKKLPLIGVLAFIVILVLTSCANIQSYGMQPPRSPGSVLNGKIIQAADDSCLIADYNSSELYKVSTKLDILGADGKPSVAPALKAGQTVEIGYSGSIIETYPAQLGSPSYLKITGQGDDLVGFYQAVINDLWHVDDGLNPNTGILAFDLSQVTNLSASEKSALVYLVSTAHGLEGITGTFDELSSQGYINREKLSFENGMLLEFSHPQVTGNSFTFDVTKWRSGTGAYFFYDCKAVKTSDGWSYTVGSSAIS